MVKDIDELYKKWFKPVRSWVRKRGVPPALIDDVAQETFMRLVRYEPEINENVVGYVFRTASNVAYELMERSYIRRQHDPYEEDILGDMRAESPEDLFESHDIEALIGWALPQLSGRRARVLMMHVYEDKTYKQIAVELGLTYRIVLRELTAAYSQLRQILAGSGLLDLYIPNFDYEEMKNGRRSARSINSYRTKPTGNAGAPVAGAASPRNPASYVGGSDRVHDDRPPTRRVSGSDILE